ncbi:MAG: hypothetical protein ACYDCB_03245 [Candidatus Dormibacteria bacterium]
MPESEPEQLGEASGEPPAEAPAVALPEFLDPESTHYQPWAEKQIFNATKEKRPLAAYMADFEERLQAYPELPPAQWDPSRQEQLLARFAAVVPGRSKRHRRRRGGASVQPVPAARSQAAARPAQPGRGRSPRRAAPPPPAPANQAVPPAGERRRRRRRRSRGGSPGGATPPVA